MEFPKHCTTDNAPKIIVLMSCYNHEKFVGEAIESILNQTYTNLELHIVDDGSTDTSKDVILSYMQDDRVHLYDLEKNTKYFGPFRQFNVCVLASDAKYVANIASDDKWKLDKLEKQIGILENNLEYKACFTWDEIIYHDNAGAWALSEGYSIKQNRSRYEWFAQFYLSGNCLNACSMLMYRSVYLELGGYNPNFRALGDQYLWMSFVMKYSFYLLPEKLTYYRRHDQNLSTADITNIGSATEQYIFHRSLFYSMEPDFLKKAFAEFVIYSNWDDTLEFIAEKIMLLLRGLDTHTQVAIDLYFEYSTNRKFVEIMENRYDFTTDKLDALIKNYGLASLGFAKNIDCSFSPSRIDILLDDINCKTLTPEKLHKYPYTFIFELLGVVSQLDNKVGYLNLIKSAIYHKQQQIFLGKQKRNIVFMIGSASEWNTGFGAGKWINLEYDNIFYCVLPKSADSFSGTKTSDWNFGLPSCAEYLEIFSKDEHYISSSIELGVYPDMLVLVDCMNSEYSWERMLVKYPMDVLVMYIESETAESEDKSQNFIFEYLEEIQL